MCAAFLSVVSQLPTAAELLEVHIHSGSCKSDVAAASWFQTQLLVQMRIPSHVCLKVGWGRLLFLALCSCEEGSVAATQSY